LISAPSDYNQYLVLLYLQGRNLVYCAPTSGGKSLVADIIFLRRFVETRRPGLLVLPFISLCNEKKAYWDNVLHPLDREAREYYGPTSTSAPISPRTGIIVATLEKANHLITQLLEENALGMLSCVIIDELHMVGDEHRGYQLELMLTKLRFAGAAAFAEEEEGLEESRNAGGDNEVEVHKKGEQWFSMMGLEEGTQIIGMSATLPNVSIVAKWLGAELFTTDFRPVPLRQFLKTGNVIQDESGAIIRTIPDNATLSSRFNLAPKELQAKDPDHVAFLAQETVDEGFSVLVFCATRGASEATATLLSQLLEVPERYILVKKDVLASTASKYGLRVVNRASIADEIARLGSSHSKKLSSLVARGVGYHHAGMEPDDKELIELAFKCGAISVLCATSSLAAGVNLPARRVIFRHPYIGRATNFLDAANYRQMRGRAGRAGIDTHGESFLLVLQKSTEKMLAALMHAEAAPVESCLTQEKCGMKRAMLEVVATGAVTSPIDVDRYIKCTLLAATSNYEVVMNATREALKWLGDKERQFIFWDKKTGR
jgi:DNA polymerase theta